MATHVVTTTTISPLSANQISVYGHPSPVNSVSATPANNSPTSPRLQHLPLQSRQLRPLKCPLYVPAALRPTERPQKSSPPTPPRSAHGSLDSLNDEEPSTLVSRRSTMESNFNNTISKLAENEWMKTEHLGQVTGLPTREHWKVSIPFSFLESREGSSGIYTLTPTQESPQMACKLVIACDGVTSPLCSGTVLCVRQ
jgi:hypothetical protein